MSNPNVEAFKVHANAELRRLLKRYVGQENTPAVRASITEMVEAKLRELVDRDLPAPKAEIEFRQDGEQLVATLRLVPAYPVVEEIADDLDEAQAEADEEEDDASSLGR